NSIFANGNLPGDMGIDLGANGVTTNDVGDFDTGANQLQNFPVLTVASNSASGTFIGGTLDCASNQLFNIDFYSNSTPDPSGAGQGQVYLGSQLVGSDGFGNAGFNLVLPVVNLIGLYITATATDTNGNTSEFSAWIVATTAALPQLSVQLTNSS